MSENTLESIKRAVDTINNPLSSNEQRQVAQNGLESLKGDKGLPHFALKLADLETVCSDFARYYAFQTLEDCVKAHWTENGAYTVQELHQVRDGVVRLLEQYAAAGNLAPTYLKEKLAHVVVEIAKRSWFFDWPEFNVTLRQIFEANRRDDFAKVFVLSILRQLVEDVFIYEDSQTILRKRELSVSLQCIFISRDCMLEKNRLYGTTTSAEKLAQPVSFRKGLSYEEACERVQGAYTLGWINVLASALDLSFLERSLLQLQALKVVGVAIEWLSPLAIDEAQLVPKLWEIALAEGPVKNAQVEAMSSLCVLQNRVFTSLVVESVDLRYKLTFGNFFNTYLGRICQRFLAWKASNKQETTNLLLHKFVALLELLCSQLTLLKQATDDEILDSISFDSLLELLRQLALSQNAAISCKTMVAWLSFEKSIDAVSTMGNSKAFLVEVKRMLAEVLKVPVTVQSLDFWADLESLSAEEYQALTRQSESSCLELMKALCHRSPALMLESTLSVFLNIIEHEDASRDESTLEKFRQDAALFEVALKVACGSDDCTIMVADIVKRIVDGAGGKRLPFTKSRILSALSIPTLIYAKNSDLLLSVLHVVLSITTFVTHTGDPQALKIRAKAFQVLQGFGKTLPDVLVPMYAEFGQFAQRMVDENQYSMAEMGKMMEFAATLLYYTNAISYFERANRFKELFEYRCESWIRLVATVGSSFESLLNYIGYTGVSISVDKEKHKALYEPLFGLKSALSRTLPATKGNARVGFVEADCAVGTKASLWCPFLLPLVPHLVKLVLQLNRFYVYKLPESLRDTDEGKRLLYFVERLREEAYGLLMHAAQFPQLYSQQNRELICCLLFDGINTDAAYGLGVVSSLEFMPLRSIPFVANGILSSLTLLIPAAHALTYTELLLPPVFKALSDRLLAEWSSHSGRGSPDLHDCDIESENSENEVDAEMERDKDLRLASRAVTEFYYRILIPAASAASSLLNDTAATPSNFLYPAIVGAVAKSANLLGAMIASMCAITNAVRDSVACSKLLVVFRHVLSFAVNHTELDGLIAGEFITAIVRLLGDGYHTEIQQEAVNLLFKYFKAYSLATRGFVLTNALSQSIGCSSETLANMEHQIVKKASSGVGHNGVLASEKEQHAAFRDLFAGVKGIQVAMKFKEKKALVVSTAEKMYFNRSSFATAGDSKNFTPHPASPTRRKDITENDDNGISFLFGEQ